MADNFFKLYKLDPMNESYTDRDYLNKIASMVAEWTRKEKKPDTSESTRRKFSELIAGAKVHESRCSDPAFIAEQRAEARTMLTADISKFSLPMAVVCSDGTSVIKEGNLDDLCARLKTSWPFITPKNIQRYLNLIDIKVMKSIGDTPIAYRNLYKSLGESYGGSVVRWISHVSTLSVLRITGLKQVTESSPFSDISYDIDVIHRRLLSITDLEKFKEVNAAALKNDIQLIKPITSDEKKYRGYLKFISISNSMPEFEKFIDENSSSMTNPAIVKSLIDKINRSGCNSSDMIVALENYCLMKNIPANFSNKELDLIACGFCGGLTAVGKDTLKCSICGAELFVKCPKCSTKISSTSNACSKCGFNLKETLENAHRNESLFEENLANGYPDLALAALSEIRREYPDYPGLSLMESRYKSLGEPLKGLLAKAESESKSKSYYALNMTCKKALQYAPKSLEIKNMKAVSDNAVTAANQYIASARGKEQAAVQAAYVKAGQVCSDHPEVINYFSSSPPEKPLELKCMKKDGSVIVRIIPSPQADEYTLYTLLRKEGSVPVSNSDGEIISEGNVSTYVDKDIRSGVDNYYAVYTKRWGVYSRSSVTFGPVTLLSDVLNATASPIDKGVRISYDIPKGCDRVRIRKKEDSPLESPDDGVEIYRGLIDRYDDLDLKDGTVYHYLITAEYSKDRVRAEYSPGLNLSCSPISIPEPVDDLAVRPSGNRYEASWSDEGSCILFISEKKLDIHGVTDISDLPLHRVDSDTVDDNRLMFDLPMDRISYIYPVTMMSNTAIVGNCRCISTLPEIGALNTNTAGDECILTFNWPKGCNDVTICIKGSSYAADIDDADAKIIRVSKSIYDRDRKVVIPVKGMKLAYMTVYSEFARGHSNGYRFVVNAGPRIDIRYVIKKNLFGPQYLEISTDTSISELPAFVIVSSPGVIPRLRTSGETVIRMDKVTLNRGMTKLNLPKKIDLKNIRYRMFFEDDDNYSTFTIIHPR